MPDRPLLILPAAGEPQGRATKTGRGGTPRLPSKTRQEDRLGPRFAALQQALEMRRARLRTEAAGLAPEEVIVLETVGFKSGLQRRTPLWSVRLGGYRVVSTARGERSLWVKNLLQQPKASYYLGGKLRESQAIVIADGAPQYSAAALSPFMRKVTEVFARYARSGWAFAILVPVKR